MVFEISTPKENFLEIQEGIPVTYRFSEVIKFFRSEVNDHFQEVTLKMFLPILSYSIKRYCFPLEFSSEQVILKKALFIYFTSADPLVKASGFLSSKILFCDFIEVISKVPILLSSSKKSSTATIDRTCWYKSTANDQHAANIISDLSATISLSSLSHSNQKIAKVICLASLNNLVTNWNGSYVVSQDFAGGTQMTTSNQNTIHFSNYVYSTSKNDHIAIYQSTNGPGNVLIQHTNLIDNDVFGNLIATYSTAGIIRDCVISSIFPINLVALIGGRITVENCHFNKAPLLNGNWVGYSDSLIDAAIPLSPSLLSTHRCMFTFGLKKQAQKKTLFTCLLILSR